MNLVARVRNLFRGEVVQVPEYDPVGEVMSRMYSDILDHRELLAEGRPDYQEYVESAEQLLNALASDEESKRAVLVIISELLKKQ